MLSAMFEAELDADRDFAPLDDLVGTGWNHDQPEEVIETWLDTEVRRFERGIRPEGRLCRA